MVIAKNGELRTKTGRTATAVVAASNSEHKDEADYICDGVDDQVEIQTALNAIAANDGGKLVQLEGAYTWTAAVTYSANDLEWEGCGHVVNDCSAIAANDGVVLINGVITGTSSALTVDGTKGQKDVTVTAAGSFSIGDWIRIRSETSFNGSSGKLGELQKIANIVGNTITCRDVLAFTYTTLDTGTVDLLTVYENITLRNMNFIGNHGVSNWHGFQIRNIYNLLIADIIWEDGYCYPISVCDVVNLEVRGCLVKDSNEPGLGYGVAVFNASRDILIHHNSFHNCRHGLTCGYGYGAKYGVQTNQIWDSNTFRYSTQAIGGCGPHNSYDGLVISNNSVMNDELGKIIGLNTVVVGNFCYNDISVGGGLRILDSAKGAVVAGNTIICAHGTQGIRLTGGREINIQGNYIEGSDACIYAEYDLVNVVIANNFINQTGAGYAIRIRADAATAKNDNVAITGNFIKCAADIGIYLSASAHNLEHFLISGNIIESPSTAVLIKTLGAGRCKKMLVTGNQIFNSANGINVSSADHVQISNNIITDITDVGIKLHANLTDYVVKGNYFADIGGTPIEDNGDDGLVHCQQSDLFMDVLAVSAIHIRSNEDLSVATPITFTLDAQPDIPRTLSAHFDSHANITEYDIEIIGVDAKGYTVTETKDEADGWDWETDNAFATITSIKMTSRTGTGVGDTMDIGITDVIGLSNIFYETGDIFKIKKNNANAIVAGAQVNTTYHTYDMSVIGLAATDDFTVWYKRNLNIIS